MLKKIQNYLLRNYPIVWNTKFIPMGITVIIFNIFFFFFGLFVGEDFNDYELYSTFINSFLFYLISFLASILILIIWLIFYFKNNGLKSFYPKNTKKLYLEWLLTFILISGNILYFYSYSQGIKFKVRSYASKEEVKKIKKLLSQIDVIIPDPDHQYKYEPETDKDSTSVHLSLLNYRYGQNSAEVKKVKIWLINRQQDSIRNLIQEYLRLQEKHHLKTNLTVDSWMKLIYNPPYYPLSDSNFIEESEPYKNSIDSKYYVEWRKLDYAYEEIYEAHYDNTKSDIFLVPLYIALSLSLAIFSFRITSGKAWLISLVISGLLSYIGGSITLILSFGNLELLIFYIYWIFIFIVMCIYMAIMLINKQSKSISSFIINLIIQMIPYLPMIYYFIFIHFNVKNNTFMDKVLEYFYNHEAFFSWINLILVIVILPFVCKIIIKWRALPEE